MKKYLITLLFMSAVIFNVVGQRVDENVFAAVPVVNGKVVFQQFIHTNQNLSEEQKYTILHKWAQDHYRGKSSLRGIRFDDKARSVTVSSGAALSLPANFGKMTMNYRFDASVTAAGIMLVVRDITYVSENSGFPKNYSAEEMITEQAVNSASELRDLKRETRKSSLAYLNKLYADLAGAF